MPTPSGSAQEAILFGELPNAGSEFGAVLSTRKPVTSHQCSFTRNVSAIAISQQFTGFVHNTAKEFTGEPSLRTVVVNC
jgi:hypothetical protein